MQTCENYLRESPFSQNKCQFFQANFPKISIFQENISTFPGKLTKNFEFSRQIDEKFRFFQVNISELPFFSHLLQNVRLSRQICHLQLNSRQIILFLLKSHHFQTYFLYMIRYNNVSRPLHDPLCDPPRPSQPTIWGWS